jgi:hypothetical protein
MVRAEWRADGEQWSRAALERWEHGRGLADVLRDAGHRGDTVTFAFPTVTWSGVITALGVDVVRLVAGDVAVDLKVALDAPWVLRTRAGSGEGLRDDGTLVSFRARMRELDGTTVCIGTVSGPLEGRLRVGRDQLRLIDGGGGIAYVPIGSVWWVRPLDDD